MEMIFSTGTPMGDDLKNRFCLKVPRLPRRKFKACG
jgi:hypothetical protein